MRRRADVRIFHEEVTGNAYARMYRGCVATVSQCRKVSGSKSKPWLNKKGVRMRLRRHNRRKVTIKPHAHTFSSAFTGAASLFFPSCVPIFTACHIYVDVVLFFSRILHSLSLHT